MATFSGRSTKAASFYNTFPTYNYGILSYVRNVDDGSNVHWGAYEWDLSSVPAGSIPSDVGTMTLYQEGTDWIGNFDHLAVYKIKREWGEGTKNNTVADTGEITWNSAKHNEVAWTTGGIGDTTNDRSGTAEDNITNPGSAGNAVGSISTATLQEWINGSNYGVTTKLENYTGTVYWYFWSDDQTGTTQDPLLEFDYSEAVSNTNPNTPSITAPADESTGNSNNPTMMSSAFDDNDVGDTHQASQWLVSDDSGFTSTEWDSGVDTEHLTTVSINASHGTFGGALAGETSLAYGTTYYAKVRHQDNNDAWSEYSTAISFTVMNEPAQEDFERNTILSNEERVTLLKAATGTASDRLSDQLIALFGTTRQKEILGIIGDDGRPFDAQLDNYLKDL